MLSYARKVYLSDDGIRLSEVKKRLAAGKAKRGLYLVTLTGNGDLFYIYSARAVCTPPESEMPLTVVGVAKGYRRALHVVERMISDIYGKQGDFDVDRFFGS